MSGRSNWKGRAMKLLKTVLATVVLALSAVIVPPPAGAQMTLGNYDFLSDRYTKTTWVWFVAFCVPEHSADCIYVSGITRRSYYVGYEGKAHLDGNQYTLVVDVPDGLQCPGQVLPTRDTYRWDQNTLQGTIDSDYDVGCSNGPPGSQFWTFGLQRL
jgi:hypothetical protein